MDTKYIMFILFIIVFYMIYKHTRCEKASVEATDIVPTSRWAVAKARNNPNYMECLQNDICPACGNKGLNEKVYGSDDQFSDHHCAKCGFTAICEVLY